MNITNKPGFNPLVITFETQEEINMIADALYEIDLENFNDVATNFLRNLRIELYEYNQCEYDSLRKKQSS